MDFARRYYLGVAANFAIEGEFDQAAERIRDRAELPHPRLPNDLPARKKLELVVSAEILRFVRRTVHTYETIADLSGADARELTRAGLKESEIKAVLLYLSALE